MKPLVLLVEDDRLLNEGLTFALKKAGYDVLSALTCEEARRYLSESHIALVILDIGLPDGSGTALCKDIRADSAIPVVFLTAQDTETDVIQGFQLGADDYIAKPFSVPVLMERIAAVLRRIGAGDRSERFTYREVSIDYGKMKVYKRGAELKLTANEYKLLEILTRNSKQVLTRELILEKLWDASGSFVDENTLSVNIRRLRAKLEDDAKESTYIKTVFGIGYTWGE